MLIGQVQKYSSNLTSEKAKEYFLYLAVSTMLYRYQFLFNNKHSFSFLIKSLYYFSFILIIFWGGLFLSKLSFKDLLKTKSNKLILVLLISYLPALAMAKSNYATLWGSYLYYLVLFLIIPKLVSLDRLFKINKAVIAYSVFAAVMSLAIAFSNPQITFDDFTSIGLLDNRLWGFTGNPNKDSLLATISLFFSLFNLLLDSNSPRFYRFLKMNIFLQLLIIAMTVSRASIGLLFLITFIPIIVFTFVAKYKKRMESRVSKTFLSLVCLGALLCPFYPNIEKLFEADKNQENAPTEINRFEPQEILKSPGRIQIWKECMILNTSSPLGTGLQNITEECKKMNPEKAFSAINAGMHNMFIEAYLGGGLSTLVVSVVLYFVLIFQFIKTFFVQVFRPSEEGVFLVLLSTFLGSLLVHAQLENTLFFSINLPSFLFWPYLGMYFNLRRN